MSINVSDDIQSFCVYTLSTRSVMHNTAVKAIKICNKQNRVHHG